MTQTTSQASPFGELPTQNGFTADAVNEDQLVTIRDAEIIKPQGVAAFYSYRVYYPEGFAGGTINEALPLGNIGAIDAGKGDLDQDLARPWNGNPKRLCAKNFWPAGGVETHRCHLFGKHSRHLRPPWCPSVATVH